MNLHDLSDLHVLTLCIWGESRGQPVEGQIAVANVVRNRWRDGAKSLTWRDVCLKPFQFSCFNEGDVNLPKIQRAATMLTTGALTPELREALWIADGVMSGAARDNTLGATHYLTTELLKRNLPRWAKGEPILVTIGAHSFLRAA